MIVVLPPHSSDLPRSLKTDLFNFLSCGVTPQQSLFPLCVTSTEDPAPCCVFYAAINRQEKDSQTQICIIACR